MTYINSRHETALQALKLLFGANGGKGDDTASTAVSAPNPPSLVTPKLSDAQRNASAKITAIITERFGQTNMASLSSERPFGGAHGGSGDDIINVRGGLVAGASGGDGNDTIDVASGHNASAWGGGGDDTIKIVAGRSADAHGGTGDDKIDVTAGIQAWTVEGNEGDDVINVTVGQLAWAVSGGDGNDLVNVNTAGMAASVGGGNGDDTINVSAGTSAYAFGGTGDDTINLATGMVASANGYDGNDTMAIVSADRVNAVYGGEGDDKIEITAAGHVKFVDGDDHGRAAGNDVITIKADSASLIYGGAGDDVITVKARQAEAIKGGAGNDVINLVDTDHASLLFNKGDGNDQVNIAGETVLTFRGRSAADARITYGDGSITVSFGDSDDTVTVNFANAKLAGETPTVDLSDVSGSDLKAGVADDFKGFWFGRAEWNELIAPDAEGGFQLKIS